MCHTKTPPIQGGALRVLPGPLAVPHGDPGAGAKAKSKARREFRSVRRGSWDPLGPAVPVGQTPQGRHTRMCAVFGRGRMPRPKIPTGTAHPPRSGGRTAGGCFFCLLFFAQAKKSRASAASGAMCEQEDPSRKAIEQGVIVDVGTVARRVEIATPWPLTPTPLSHRDFLRSPVGDGLNASKAPRSLQQPRPAFHPFHPRQHQLHAHQQRHRQQ